MVKYGHYLLLHMLGSEVAAPYGQQKGQPLGQKVGNTMYVTSFSRIINRWIYYIDHLSMFKSMFMVGTFCLYMLGSEVAAPYGQQTHLHQSPVQ